MSDERIDLTQFEGMTKQSLALRGVIYVGDGASVECGLDDPRCQTIDIGNVARMNEDRLGYVRPAYAEEQWSKTLATARLFSEAPELIAELKRCYDLIDCLEDEMEFVLQQLHRPIMGGLEWYEVRNNILNQLITNANSSTIQVLEALEQPASE